MKIWKLALAVLLAAGAVAAYKYFPNPLEQPAEAQTQGPTKETEDLPAPVDSATPAAEQAPAGGAEST